MLTKLVVVCFMALVLLSTWAVPAQAYLDMGTGSMILQAIVASLAGVAVFLRIFWARIKSFFSGSKPQAKPENVDDKND